MDTPIIKKISYFRIIPQLLLIVVLTFLFEFFGLVPDLFMAFVYSYIILILYRYLIRYTLTVEHVKGIHRMKKGQFEEAIKNFSKSYEFFDRHRNLDKWRSILFLSPGQYGYREMSLTNIAFAYSQLGNGDKAREYYQSCLKDYPHNGLAISAINIINSAGK